MYLHRQLDVAELVPRHPSRLLLPGGGPEKRERIRLNMLEELKIKEGEDFIEGM
jgi:hypothetical protein